MIPAIGKIPLTQLRPEHLQRLYSDKQTSGRKYGNGGLGNRSIRYIHQTIHRALKSAVKLGMITRNVADAVDVPKITRREMKFMTEPDIHIFLEFARNTEYYYLFYLALLSGMRRSELLGLKWGDTDLDLGHLSVIRTLHRIGGKIIIWQPRTAKGKRLIALSPSTCLILKGYKIEREKLYSSLGKALSDEDYVFAHHDGQSLHPNSVTYAWHKVAQKIGLEGVRFHDARHSHASLLLKQDVHPAIVAQRLGHASVQITLDIYSHILPGLQEATAKRLDDLIKPEKDGIEKIG